MPEGLENAGRAIRTLAGTKPYGPQPYPFDQTPASLHNIFPEVRE